MRGLYKGKYLIVCYDEDELPIFVCDNSTDFAEKYSSYFGFEASSGRALLARILSGERPNTRTHVRLVEADTVIKDCFEEADRDFIKFIEEEYRQETVAEKCQELGINPRTYYRWKQAGKIKGLEDIDKIVEYNNKIKNQNLFKGEIHE